MKIVISESHDPYENLCTEELLLKNDGVSEDIIYFYVNHNSVIIGRNQNAHEEVYVDYLQDNKIKLVRRVSGGGAVYHDKGNLNFSFITKKQKNSYENFLSPIIDFLKSLGLDAQFKGKNDLTISGTKISGNAQYIFKDRMFHHGTLLFDADLTKLGEILKPNLLKLESKSIKSIRQRVSNIVDFLDDKITASEFLVKLEEFFTDKFKVEKLDMSIIDKDKLQQLMNIRKSSDWVYGKNPKFSLNNELRFDGGTIRVSMDVQNNLINDLLFTGDFLSKNNFEKVYKYFIGSEYNKTVINNILQNIDNFDEYFGKIEVDELISLIFGASNSEV